MSFLRMVSVIAVGAFVATVLFTTSNAAGGPQAPVDVTKLKFLPIMVGDTFAVEVGEKTAVVTTDKDGDTQSLAVFRITVREPINSGGKSAAVFINAIMGVCGSNGIVVLMSKVYSPSGELLKTVLEPQPYPVGEGVSPASVTYEHLCAKTSGNKSNSRNNKNYT